MVSCSPVQSSSVLWISTSSAYRPVQFSSAQYSRTVHSHRSSASSSFPFSFPFLLLPSPPSSALSLSIVPLPSPSLPSSSSPSSFFSISPSGPYCPCVPGCHTTVSCSFLFRTYQFGSHPTSTFTTASPIVPPSFPNQLPFLPPSNPSVRYTPIPPPFTNRPTPLFLSSFLLPFRLRSHPSSLLPSYQHEQH